MTDSMIMDGRLREAIDLAGGIEAVMQGTAASKSAVYKYRKEETVPPVAFLRGVSILAKLRLQWILDGSQPKFDTPESGEWDAGQATVEAAMVHVPVLDVVVSAGGGGEALSEMPVAHFAIPRDMLRGVADPDALDLVTVRGDSMEPELRGGDMVLVDRNQKIAREGIVVARIDGQLLVKRLAVVGVGRAELVSTNALYRPIPIDMNDPQFTIIGRVAYVWKAM